MSASLTGLTFLYELVLDRQSGMLGGAINWYANTATDRTATQGFRHQQSWRAFGKRSPESAGRRYYLSAMLGYTSVAVTRSMTSCVTCSEVLWLTEHNLKAPSIS